MKSFKLLTVLSVFVSFIHFNYAQDSLIQMSEGSIKRVTYLSHGKNIGKGNAFKPIPILDTNLYQKYGERKYMESFEHPTVVDTLTEFKYNDFLTQKTSTPVILKLSQGRRILKTYLSSSPPYWTWEWIYMLGCAIILFHIRRRWNTLDRYQRGSLLQVFSLRNLITSIVIALILLFSISLCPASWFYALKQISGLSISLVCGLIVGFIASLVCFLEDEPSNAWINSLVLSLVFALCFGEISWYAVLYIGILLTLAYLLGYLMRKESWQRVVEGNKKNKIPR